MQPPVVACRKKTSVRSANREERARETDLRSSSALACLTRSLSAAGDPLASAALRAASCAHASSSSVIVQRDTPLTIRRRSLRLMRRVGSISNMRLRTEWHWFEMGRMVWRKLGDSRKARKVSSERAACRHLAVERTRDEGSMMRECMIERV